MRGQTASGFDTQARVHPAPRLRLLAFASDYTDTASDSMSSFSPLGTTAAAALASLPTMADSRYGDPNPKKGPVTKLPTSSRKKGRSQNSRPHPEKRLDHKTRDPNPKKGSVTKLETPSRKKGRSQNSRPHPEKRVGHKTPDPNPKKGSVTKLATPSRKKGRSQNSRPHHRADPTLATATTNPRSTNNSIHTVRMRADIPHLCGAVMLCIQSAVSPLND